MHPLAEYHLALTRRTFLGRGLGAVAPPSRSARSARARAASTNCGSFISTRAWSGVSVRSRRTVHASREGASKAVICGGGDVRFQKV